MLLNAGAGFLVYSGICAPEIQDFLLGLVIFGQTPAPQILFFRHLHTVRFYQTRKLIACLAVLHGAKKLG